LKLYGSCSFFLCSLNLCCIVFRLSVRLFICLMCIVWFKLNVCNVCINRLGGGISSTGLTDDKPAQMKPRGSVVTDVLRILDGRKLQAVWLSLCQNSHFYADTIYRAHIWDHCNKSPFLKLYTPGCLAAICIPSSTAELRQSRSDLVWLTACSEEVQLIKEDWILRLGNTIEPSAVLGDLGYPRLGLSFLDIKLPMEQRNQRNGCSTLQRRLYTEIRQRLNVSVNPLTPTVDAQVQQYKASCARPVKPSFVIFDIRALWRSAMSVPVPGCQKW